MHNNSWKSTPLGHHFKEIPGHTVKIRPTKWIWRGFLPLSQTILWAGDGGMGKTTALLELCARVSQGTDFPGGEVNLLGVPGRVLFLNDEDSVEESTAPKLIAAGANMENITFTNLIDHYRHDEEMGDQWKPELIWDLTTQYPAIHNWAEDYQNAALVVIDPVTAFMGKSDANSNTEVKTLITKLNQVAIEDKICIVLITHLNRRADVGLRERIMGSKAWEHGPRMNFVVEGDAKESEIASTVVSDLICTKANTIKKPLPRRFRLEERVLTSTEGGEEIRVPLAVWDEMPIEEGCLEPEEQQKSKRGRGKEREEVKTWIRRLLVRPLEATELHTLAERQKFAWNRVQRALKEMIEEEEIIRQHPTGNVYLYSRYERPVERASEVPEEGEKESATVQN